MGCPLCNVHDCDNTLQSVHDHFCAEHDHLNCECAIVSCSQPIEKGFKTCMIPEHCKAELLYHECGKAMFQLKKRLEHLKISQTHDSMSLGSSADVDGPIPATAAVPTSTPGSMGDQCNDMDDLEGSGESDEKVLVDLQGEICNGKDEAGNQAPCALFGCRHSHNKELCVASCGVIQGRERFYGSKAPNGVCVSHLSFTTMGLCTDIVYEDFYDVSFSNSKFTA